MQEKIDLLNERLDQVSSGTVVGKEESSDVADGSMQAWKQSVKKCKSLNLTREC